MRPELHFSEAPHCAVGWSRICAGQGVFAIDHFSAGDIVVDYSRKKSLWRLMKFEDLSSECLESMWWVGVDDAFALVADPASVFMRVNHSPTPNTFWDTQKCTLTALEDILIGSEITYDYRLEKAPEFIKKQKPSWVS